MSSFRVAARCAAALGLTALVSLPAGAQARPTAPVPAPSAATTAAVQREARAIYFGPDPVRAESVYTAHHVRASVCHPALAEVYVHERASAMAQAGPARASAIEDAIGKAWAGATMELVNDPTPCPPGSRTTERPVMMVRFRPRP